MKLIKWDPIAEFDDVSTRLNRLFGRSLINMGSDHDRLTMADWKPFVDISETDAAYMIKAEIPEVKKSDVKLTLQNGMLILQGERKMEKEEKDVRFHRIERAYGSFERSFRMPDDADEAAIKAEFKDGIIEITLPKTAEAKSKEVTVEISG
jgi:HSP20 family protein